MDILGGGYIEAGTTFKARVRRGRLVLDVPTDLPEGTEVELFMEDADDLDEEERAALHAAIAEGIAQAGAGQTISADELLAELRSAR